MGSKFNDTSLKNVLFKNCLAKYSSLAFSKLNNIIISNCNFQDSNFQEVKLNKIEFQNSNLINCYFNKTSLNKIDLTTCDITGLDLEIPDLAGATVTTMQALELTRLLNINIKLFM